MSNRRRDSRSQRWSACSLRQLRYFLTSGRGSCLANYPAPSAITLPGRRALPGQAISLDTQCFKVAEKNLSRQCSDIFCQVQIFLGSKVHTNFHPFSSHPKMFKLLPIYTFFATPG